MVIFIIFAAATAPAPALPSWRSNSWLASSITAYSGHCSGFAHRPHNRITHHQNGQPVRSCAVVFGRHKKSQTHRPGFSLGVKF